VWASTDVTSLRGVPAMLAKVFRSLNVPRDRGACQTSPQAQLQVRPKPMMSGRVASGPCVSVSAAAGAAKLLTPFGRVEMWRGGDRFGLSVAAPFVWRCPSTRAVAPFPHPAHRTGQADFPHPALGQDSMLSPSGSRGCRCRGCDRRVRDLGSIEHDTVPPLPAPPVAGRRVSRT